MKIHLGDSGYGAEHQVFQAGLRRRGYRNGVAVTPKASRNPKHIDLLHAFHQLLEQIWEGKRLAVRKYRLGKFSTRRNSFPPRPHGSHLHFCSAWPMLKYGRNED